MSDATTRARIDNPFDGGMQFEQPGGAPREMVPVAGAATDRAQAAIVTAQRVAVKRNLPNILSEARSLATAAGDKFYYSMPFKEKTKDGGERTVLVEGPAIGCSMAALSCYGNCAVEAFPANETQTHWTFMARFTDYEKGVTVIRSFQQRKGQNVGGRMDRGRAEDIVFQIGQSKAIRNVIIAGLKWLTDEMFAAAKSGVVERIGKNPEKAREWLVWKLEQVEVELKRVERVIGRTADKWTVRDMARIFSEMQAIEDGFADADDLYPASQAEGEQLREDVEASAGHGAARDASTGDTTPSPDETASRAAAGEGTQVSSSAAKPKEPRKRSEKRSEGPPAAVTEDGAQQENQQASVAAPGGEGERAAHTPASAPATEDEQPEQGEQSAEPAGNSEQSGLVFE